MKRKIDLTLSLTEKDGEAILKITKNGKSILRFQNDDAPPVRIIGFNKPALTREELLEFAEREACDYEHGPIGALEHYIYDRERSMYSHLLELRKIMRKLVKVVEAANAASSLAQELAATQQDSPPAV